MSASWSPCVFNLFKPARMGSFDLVRNLKRTLPKGYGKIGHFGTLDPFACGVLLVGVSGAARLNDLIHSELPKTYLAVGKLGIETDTGDWEGKVLQTDQSEYSRTVIRDMDNSFIEKFLREKFLGDYWQAPPQFSATKYQGRPLHEWAREGVMIKKDEVLRKVYSLDVVRYEYPYLSLRVTVGSGTYIRTMFKEAANALGTIGSLIALQRESIGALTWKEAIKPGEWKDINWHSRALSIEDVLPFPREKIPPDQEKPFQNGMPISWLPSDAQYAWAMGCDEKNWGLLVRGPGGWKISINFKAMNLSGTTH